MKKIISFFAIAILLHCFIASLLLARPAWAACAPPSDYSSCPEQSPEYNINVRGYTPVSGSQTLIPFNHPGDPNAPLLSTLIAGNGQPTITNLYQVNDWNWNNNQAGGPIPRPVDLPAGFDFATLVGFSTQNGQGILVPNSGYDIGGGYTAVVLFATPTSITLKYALGDNVVDGYTIHLENFQVDASLLDLYNQLDGAGRDELPILGAGMQIGQAMGNEILVSIRDTGSFMDPRWLNDWWLSLDPAVAQQLLLKTTKTGGQIAQKYGQCTGNCPGIEICNAPRTTEKGPSIELTLKTCRTFFDEATQQTVTEKVQKIVDELYLDSRNGKNFKFPDFTRMENVLDKQTLQSLTMMGKKPVTPYKTTLGTINFDVCQKDTHDWFKVSSSGDFKAPTEWTALNTTSQSLARLFTQAVVPGNYKTEINNEERPAKLIASSDIISPNLIAEGPNTGGQTGCPSNYFEAAIENIKTEGGKITSYGMRVRKTELGQQVYPDPIFDIEIRRFVGGGEAGFHNSGAEMFRGNGNELYYDTSMAGAEAFMPLPETGSAEELGQWTWDISFDASQVVNPGCQKSFKVTSSGAPLKPIPPPPPPLCKPHNPSGEPMLQVKGSCAYGTCVLTNQNDAPGFTNWFSDLWGQLLGMSCPEITFYITPKYDTPYAAQIDQSVRGTILKFAPMGTSLPKINSLEDTIFERKDTKEKYPSKTNISGATGVKKSWDWLQQALTQYNENLSRGTGSGFAR